MSSTVATAQTAPPLIPVPRLRLEFLDGLRGLAALYVVAGHAYFEANMGIVLPHLLGKLTYWLYFDRAAVDVFIVLSGFCLMLPVVKSPAGQFSGGLQFFALRRARRILPPYYAALALSLSVMALLPGLGRRPDVFLATALPAFRPDVIISHLLLIHNLNPGWSHKIDYPMWSVATEWQIYLVFALLLLPLWRRYGSLTTLTVAFTMGFLLMIVWPSCFVGASSHFLGLFALGMAGAEVSVSTKPNPSRLREGLPWGSLTVGFFLLVGIVYRTLPKSLRQNDIATDFLVGLMTACLLIFCTRHCHTVERRPRVLRVLEARAAVGLGLFSYSLYLVHAPILGIVHYAIGPFSLSPTKTLITMLALGVPLSLGASYAFHLAFERPFLAAPVQPSRKSVFRQGRA